MTHGPLSKARATTLNEVEGLVIVDEPLFALGACTTESPPSILDGKKYSLK